VSSGARSAYGLCEREVFVNADSAARQMIVEKAQVVNPEPWIVGDMDAYAKRE